MDAHIPFQGVLLLLNIFTSVVSALTPLVFICLHISQLQVAAGLELPLQLFLCQPHLLFLFKSFQVSFGVHWSEVGLFNVAVDLFVASAVHTFAQTHFFLHPPLDVFAKEVRTDVP